MAGRAGRGSQGCLGRGNTHCPCAESQTSLESSSVCVCACVCGEPGALCTLHKHFSAEQHSSLEKLLLSFFFEAGSWFAVQAGFALMARHLLGRWEHEVKNVFWSEMNPGPRLRAVFPTVPLWLPLDWGLHMGNHCSRTFRSKCGLDQPERSPGTR